MNRVFSKFGELFSKYYNKYKYVISPCLLASLLSCLIFFMMILLTTSSMGSSHWRTLRCAPSDNDGSNIYNNTVYLVHDGHWSQNQLEMLKRIKNDYQHYHIQLDLITHDEKTIAKLPASQNYQVTSSTTSPSTTPTTTITTSAASTATPKLPSPLETVHKILKRNSVKKQLIRERRGTIPVAHNNNEPVPFHTAMKGLLDILFQHRFGQGAIGKLANDNNELMHNIKHTNMEAKTTENFSNIIENFPNLSIRNRTLTNVFIHSPLEQHWIRFDKPLVYFAIRVLHLWEHGGLSFKLDDDNDVNLENNLKKQQEVDNLVIATNNIRYIPPDPTAAKELIDFIETGSLVFESLFNEILTADDKGLHIFIKTPCHVFLEEIIMNLRHAVKGDTPHMIIRKSLRTFCRKSGRKSYCKGAFIHSMT